MECFIIIYFQQERVECQDRMERRAIRDRVALDRSQVMRNLMLKGDLSEMLEQRIKHLEASQDRKSTENQALMRNLLRGSKRRKRAIISELQSGSLRRALSEDELGPGDEEETGDDENRSEDSNLKKPTNGTQNVWERDDDHKFVGSSAHPILVDLHFSSDQRRRRHAGTDEVQDVTANLESLTVQSEFGFPSAMTNSVKRYLPLQSNNKTHHHNLSYYDSFDRGELQNVKLSKQKQCEYNTNQDLEVSDHPHLYQNTLQALHHPEAHSTSFYLNSSRRNSVR